MALDVYVGSLTRYYAGEWENVVERASGERSGQYQIGPFADPSDRVRNPLRIQPAIEVWRSTLNTSLGGKLEQPLDWDETLDASYFTGRPGWDGFGSLVLWAAYTEHPTMRRPATLPEEWDDDAALMRSNAPGFRSRFSHLVRNVELWLPNPFEFTFEGEDVDGRRVVVGSTMTLRRQLDELNAATWKAAAPVVAEWSRAAPVDNAPLEICARYAFTILLDLSRQAVENRLPMKLDY